MKNSCIVVEDEPLALERMLLYIKKIPTLEIVAIFDNATDAYNFLQSNTPHIIFLDINLGKLSGIQLLESIPIKSSIIITTAYPDFALKGYDLNVTDYLLKPFTFDRFLQAYDKVQKPAVLQQAPVPSNFFFIKTANRLEKIFLDDVLYIEGKRDYRKIHTLHKNIMTLQTFTELEKEMPVSEICRVHKSYMVAINKIEAFEKDRILIQNIQIPVSETYKQRLLNIIKR